MRLGHILVLKTSDPGVQVWTRRVDPPCLRADSPQVHSFGKQIVNVASFVAHLDSDAQKVNSFRFSTSVITTSACPRQIGISLTSPYGGGHKGRVHRKLAAAISIMDASGDDIDEE
ncbi:hypothetical protein RSAG8_13508, partial [Rhizoctonia solani AG-8 WAC10335]